MTSAVRTGLRRLATLLAGVAQAVIAYELHAFDGWAWRGLVVLCCLFLAVVVRLCIAEGRERERAARGG